MKNVNNFQIAKVQLQPGVADKSAAYKKKLVVELERSGLTLTHSFPTHPFSIH